MNKRWIILILMLTLTPGCGTANLPAPSMTSVETSTRTAMQNRLDRLLESCLKAAQTKTTPQEAEAAAKSAYLQWKQNERGETQFQVQAQRLSNGSLQLQLQAQLAEGAISLQAQRQAILTPNR